MRPITREQLIKDYVAAIGSGNAALFVGAGLSRQSGYVDWKALLRGCAEELGLDLDREHDLVAVAQYYVNVSAQSRYRLSQLLADEFSRLAQYTENHRLLSHLPVSTIWTTNFDTLLEDSLEDAGRHVSRKCRDVDITLAGKRHDVVLYKMHGDVAAPSEIVICKEDYERYAKEHPVFQTTLQADLVAKTFLFLGFSFADPNLNYMLGHLHALLHDHQHQHFAIMRRAREKHPSNADTMAAYEYARNKQELMIGELQRYGIRTHLVDNYSEVTDILRLIGQASLHNNVCVAGSANKFEDGFDEERARDLCVRLGEALVARGRKIISGFGLNIGEALIKGAVLRLYADSEDATFEDHIVLRPFPREVPPDISEEAFLERYRRNMITQSGFVVFIAGTSRSSLVSVGVMDEYRIARAMHKIPIPIGATGFAAERIWTEVREVRDEVYGGRVSSELYDRLADRSLSNEEIVTAVFQIMDAVPLPIAYASVERQLLHSGA